LKRHNAPRGAAPWIGPALVLLTMLVLAQPASAVRVCTYNLYNWPDGNWMARVDDFQLIMDEIDADLVIVQEVESQLGANNFLLHAMNATEPGEYWFMPFANGPDTDNVCYFKEAVFESLYHEQLSTPVRQTSVYYFGLVGYESDDANLTILSTHLKAGSSSSDASTRLAQTTIIRNFLNDFPSGSNFIMGGDFNVRTSGEQSYQQFVGVQTDNDGRSRDPILTPGYWHDSYTYRHTHTQATTLDWGGMDDRFDQLLVSFPLDDGVGWDYIEDTYTAFGNDGFRLNQAINDPPNQIVSQEMADALATASDHLPVYADFQLPAKIEAPGELAFGTVIVGGSPVQILVVANVGVVPADDLTYALTAPSGFSAPGGSFELAAGENTIHILGMETGSVGEKSGDLAIDSNCIDNPSWNVALTGTVVDHANPSLAGGEILLDDTLDFGTAPAGMFDDETLLVYNDGHDALQALLEIYDAEIVGGDGRFSFVGGFTEKSAGGDPAEYVINFDSATAAWDSLYTATLTLSTRDESGVPGGTTLDDLTVNLQAYVMDGTSVGDDELVLALSPGMPNPFTERTALFLALPSAGSAVVEIYDVAGKLVRTLVSGDLPAGQHRVSWDGRDGAGIGAASGIYFCRAEVGHWREARKLILLR